MNALRDWWATSLIGLLLVVVVLATPTVLVLWAGWHALGFAWTWRWGVGLACVPTGLGYGWRWLERWAGN